MRKYLAPAFAIPYAIALAIAVVATVFFGWAGFWLGFAIVVLVRVARWGIPLIKLSYQPAPANDSEPPEATDASRSSTQDVTT